MISPDLLALIVKHSTVLFTGFFALCGGVSTGAVWLYMTRSKFNGLLKDVEGIMNEPEKFIAKFSLLETQQKNLETLVEAEKRASQENYNTIISDLDEISRRYSQSDIALRAIGSKIDLLALEVKLTRDNQKENQERLESQIRDVYERPRT